MIEPMKKVSVLLYHEDQDRYLRTLQDLGVLHIEQQDKIDSAALDTISEKIRLTQRVLQRFNALEKRSSSVQDAKIASLDGISLVEGFSKAEKDLEKCEQAILALHKDLALLEPWGDFPSAKREALAAVGLQLKFYEASETQYAALDLRQHFSQVIRQKSSKVLFVVGQLGQAPESVEADEVTLPLLSLSETQKRLSDLIIEQKSLYQQLELFASRVDGLQAYLAGLQEERVLILARQSFVPQVAAKVLYMIGWVPSQQANNVREFLQQFSAWFAIEEPVATDRVPVKMKNSQFATLLEPVTKIFALPDYFEIDPDFGGQHRRKWVFTQYLFWLGHF